MNELSEIAQGIVLVISMHSLAFLLAAPIMFIANYLQIYIIVSAILFAALGIGISQFIYIVPLIVSLNRKRQWGLMKGVIIGSVITALLNGGCWLWAYSAFTQR